MKFFKRYSVIFFVIVLLFSLVPFQAFADPVTASVIANAFAQAIASYGAVNGVALTFDVSSADGIGETVHELWKDFRDGTQTADDYATIAQAIFPELYYKSSVALGTASDVYAVGVHISDTYAETLDDFYNWLLSGPAEMVQVDNQYYQFSQAQIGPDAVFIPVYSFPTLLDSVLPYISSPVADANTFNSSYLLGRSSNGLSYIGCLTSNISSEPAYVFITTNGSNIQGVVCSVSTGAKREISRNVNTGNYNLSSNSALNQNFTYSGVTLHWTTTSALSEYSGPYYSSINEGLQAVATAISDPSSVSSDTVGVKAYTESGIADIPDTADPNYDALNRAKDIPLNIPWDDTIYGDGSGSLTDAQAGAIAGDLTQALELDGTVELVEESNPPAPSPDYSDVLLPLIPLNVPSFNFSLSGIWHYVRSWVTSLGAWLSMMFSVWGILPYAIVVPVYACLVIVIVLGLYKRFFM